MSRLLATTLGRVMPRYRTVGAWVEVYRQILTTRQLAPKTVANRENSLRYLLAAPGYGAPSLHECRSLSERLFRAQGIDTRILLGHKHQAMTDVYNDDRGLLAASWQVLALPQ